MDKVRTIWGVVLVAVCSLAMQTVIVDDGYAAVEEKDALKATVVVDKGVYAEGDGIKVDAIVTNTNPYTVSNVGLTVNLPITDLTVTSGSTSAFSGTLASGQSLSLAFTLGRSGGVLPPDTGVGDAGDDEATSSWVAIVISAIGISVLIAVFAGKKRYVKLLAVFVLLGGVVGIGFSSVENVYAAGIQKSFDLSESALFEGGDVLEFVADVEYELTKVAVTYYPNEGEHYGGYGQGTPYTQIVNVSDEFVPIRREDTDFVNISTAPNKPLFQYWATIPDTWLDPETGEWPEYDIYHAGMPSGKYLTENFDLYATWIYID